MTIHPLTSEQVDAFNWMFDNQASLALVASALDGEPVTVIAAITESDGTVYVTPLAIMLEDSMFERLSDPQEGL